MWINEVFVHKSFETVILEHVEKKFEKFYHFGLDLRNCWVIDWISKVCLDQISLHTESKSINYCNNSTALKKSSLIIKYLIWKEKKFLKKRYFSPNTKKNYFRSENVFDCWWIQIFEINKILVLRKFFFFSRWNT